MKLNRLPDGWWIVRVHLPDVTECGPYEGKAGKSDAADDLAGLERFFAANPRYRHDGCKSIQPIGTAEPAKAGAVQGNLF